MAGFAAKLNQHIPLSEWEKMCKITGYTFTKTSALPTCIVDFMPIIRWIRSRHLIKFEDMFEGVRTVFTFWICSRLTSSWIATLKTPWRSANSRGVCQILRQSNHWRRYGLSCSDPDPSSGSRKLCKQLQKCFFSLQKAEMVCIKIVISGCVINKDDMADTLGNICKTH